jgi:hypothetical protein
LWPNAWEVTWNAKATFDEDGAFKGAQIRRIPVAPPPRGDGAPKDHLTR